MKLFSTLFKKAEPLPSDRGARVGPSPLQQILAAPPLRMLPRDAAGAPDYQRKAPAETAGERVQRLITEAEMKRAFDAAHPVSDFGADGIAFPADDGKGAEDLAESPEVRENTAAGEPVVEFRPAMAVTPEEWDRRPPVPASVYRVMASDLGGEVNDLRARCEELENRLRWSHQREEKLRAEVESALASNRGWREANWRLMQKMEALKEGVKWRAFYIAQNDLMLGALFSENGWMPKLPLEDYFRAWLFASVKGQSWEAGTGRIVSMLRNSWLPATVSGMMRDADVSRWLGKMAIEFPEVVGRCRAKNGARQWRLDGTKIPAGGLDAWRERRAD